MGVLKTTALMEDAIQLQLTRTGELEEERAEGVKVEVELDVEEPAFVYRISSRMEKAVHQLISIMSDNQKQLDHARLTQTELMKEKFSHDQQIAELLIRQDELQQKLQEEREARERLALQLQHAEGLIDGYSGERRVLEDQVREGTATHLQLEAELQMTISQLQQLQQKKQEIGSPQELLPRQQEVMKGGATDFELRLVESTGDVPDSGLLEETEKLIQEKVDVQLQAQKDHAELHQQVKELEAELEEQVRSRAQLEEAHLADSSDLQQQIQALEKQLEKNRRFLDEQAADREHERDAFQQEIQKLEEQLRSSSTKPTDHRQMEELSEALKEKSDWCSDLLQREEELQKEKQERDEEIGRLAERVRVLEETLVSRPERSAPPTMENSKLTVCKAAGSEGSTLEVLLQTEREALDRKEKEIVNLEEQLEQFREELQNKSEEVQQLHMQLEIQRKEISTQQEELQTRTSLQTEVEEKKELVRELEVQVEYLRGEQDHLKRHNEEEVDQLNCVIEKLQQELSNMEPTPCVQGEEDGEHDELRQKMEQVQKELAILQEEHLTLLNRYGTLQQEGVERQQAQMEDLLREKMAALVVAQVQIRALEESASSTVTVLTQRVEQLEKCVEEKDMEVKECQMEVNKAQSDAGTLHLKICQLEEQLKEKMSSLTSREHQEHQLSAPQTRGQESEERPDATADDSELDRTSAGDITDEVQHGTLLQEASPKDVVTAQVPGGAALSGKRVDFNLQQETSSVNPPPPTAGSGFEPCDSPLEKENLLMNKLRNLELDLGSMQRDQDLQKHLLISSEEEALEFKRRLAKLIDLLTQLGAPAGSPAAPAKSPAGSPAAPTVSPAESPTAPAGSHAHAESPVAPAGSHTAPTKAPAESPTESPAAPTVAPAAPAGSHTAPTKAPAESPAAPAESHDAPTKSPAAPAGSPAAPTKSPSKSPAALAGSPANAGSPTESHTAPTKSSTKSTAAPTGSPPTESPTESTAAPTKSPAAPTGSPAVPDESLESSSVPAESPAAPTGSPAVPAESLAASTRSPTAPTESPSTTTKAPAEAPAVPAESPAVPDESPKSSSVPTESPTAPTGSPAAPAESPSTTTKAPAESPAVPDESPKSSSVPAESPAAPTGSPAAPAESPSTTTKAPAESPAVPAESNATSEIIESSLPQPTEKLGSSAAPARPVEPASAVAPESSSASNKSAAASSAHGAPAESSAQVWSQEATTLEKLQRELLEVKRRSDDAQEELNICRKLSQNLQEEIQVKQKMVENLQEELQKVSHLTSTEVNQELQEVRSKAQATEEELNCSKAFSRNLQEQIQEREMMITLLKNQLQKVGGETENADLLQELHNIKEEAAATKEELNTSTERSIRLQEQIQARDSLITQLMEELQQVRSALSRFQDEKLTLSRKEPGQDENAGREGTKHKDQVPLSMKNPDTQPSAPLGNGSSNTVLVDMGTQMEQPDLGAELEEVIGEYTEKIGQIRELHAAEIMDMENRHISESESLKKENQRLEDECENLRTSICNLPSVLNQEVRSEPAVYRDGSTTSDSSLDVVSEFRRTPEGARPDDAHLPERIKALLREVHQEGMQVLALSEGGAPEDPADRSSLLAEIQRLRTQLSLLQQHHTVATTAGRGGGQVLVGGDEEELMEDECENLKVELAQVRLELELCVQTQHTHLRELDTLRAELCMKVAQLDSVSDQLVEEQKRVRELQWELERERCQVERRMEGEREELEDVRLALQEEKLLSAQKDSELGNYINLHTQLQVQLDSHRSQVRELTSDLQKEKTLNAQLITQLQRPLQVQDSAPSVPDSVLQAVQLQLREKQDALVELMERSEQKELQELQERQVWDEERKHLSRQVEQLQNLLQREKTRGRELESERERLRLTVTEQGQNLHRQAETTSNQGLQQQSDDVTAQDSARTPVRHPPEDPGIMKNIISELRLISNRASRLPLEGTVGETGSWIQRNLQEVICLLQKLSAAPPAGHESAALQFTEGFSTLTERLLRQNAELTGFVSRLTEEKNDLRNQLLRLEEEVRRLRHLQAHSTLSVASDGQDFRSSNQMEAWRSERTRMEASLRQAEAELLRLRGQIRSDMLLDPAASDSDNTVLKRLYGKYLRSESFRKALIYQKKYLLLLLGGFRECEDATLSLIARLAGPHIHTHTPRLDSENHRRHGYTRFRTAARVCIAISRMHFLVRRWQKVTGGSININRNGLGPSPVEMRNDSPYLQPYTERRGTTSRGRTGRDSPHTTHSTQHRLGGVLSADGGVLCSHLQNYDPDRALSDYISRLEALQRRLGAVQSGSTPYTQMHLGIRR